VGVSSQNARPCQTAGSWCFRPREYPTASRPLGSFRKILSSNHLSLPAGPLCDLLTDAIGAPAQLVGQQATADAIRAGFRAVAKARQRDKVFIYLNGETVVVDKAGHGNDDLRKYFLPYDVNLKELEDKFQAGGSDGAIKFLDEKAISFDWIEDVLTHADKFDHVYLQSRNAIFICDCEFPGRFSGMRRRATATASFTTSSGVRSPRWAIPKSW